MAQTTTEENLMEDPFSTQLAAQREATIKETRKWVRAWEPDQREMVLWILEEEVRHDKLMDFVHEDGSKTKSEKLN